MAGDAQSRPTFTPLRRWTIGFNVGLGVVAALALAGMANYLSARHHWRFQLTRHARVELSAETLRVLRSLTNQVTVTVFFDTAHEKELYPLVAALLKEYNDANPNIVLDTVDPTRQPSKAVLALAKYKLTAIKSRNFVVIDCEGRLKVIYQNELSDYRPAPPDPGHPAHALELRRAAFNGEELFTTAIYNLAHPVHFKIGFTEGHGEHDPDGAIGLEDSYSKFAQALKEKTNAEWEKVSLLGTNEIPGDCQLLVVGGPRQVFRETELAKIDNFLRQGGRLFALLSNPSRNPSRSSACDLEFLLGRWNVAVGSKIIIDPRWSVSGELLDLNTAQMNTEHPVMKALWSDSEINPLWLVRPRAIQPARIGSPAPDAPHVDVLVWTSDKAVAVSDAPDGVPTPNSVLDQVGKFPLAVAVEQGDIKGVSAQRGATRIIVVGDSYCLANRWIDSASGNHYFATLAVNWLLDRPQILLENIVPQQLKNYRLLMTERQLQNAELLLLGGLPGAFMFVGALVWWRRRH